MIFQLNRSKSKIFDKITLQIANNKTLEQVQQFKYLGLMIDN